MSLPSYKKDPLGEIESYNTSRDVQPTPFRANQLIQQDRAKRGPLQRYNLPKQTFWHKHSRALSATAIGAFIIIYTGWAEISFISGVQELTQSFRFKYDAFLEGEEILKRK